MKTAQRFSAVLGIYRKVCKKREIGSNTAQDLHLRKSPKKA